MKVFAIAATAVALALIAGCAAGPADRNSQPNSIQRSKILSQNEYGITIEHSEWGKPIAFRQADEHCASMKKAAIYRGGTMQIGPDMTSAWRCE